MCTLEEIVEFDMDVINNHANTNHLEEMLAAPKPPYPPAETCINSSTPYSDVTQVSDRMYSVVTLGNICAASAFEAADRR